MKLKILFAGLMVGLSMTANAGLLHSYDYMGDAVDAVTNKAGVINGAVLTEDRFGNENGAYLFDGESYIDSVIDFSNVKTVEVWAKLGQQTDSGDMLFSLGASTREGSGTNLWLNEGYDETGAAFNAWDSATNIFYGDAINSLVRDGKFHHFVLTNDEITGDASLYIDSVLVGVADYRHITDDFFRVGAGRKDLKYAWDGVIDEVNLYSDLRDGTQIDKMFNVNAVSVSEPSTFGVLGLSAIGLVALRRRKSKR